ncbi:MAG TPA: DUF4349 domain-containing protein [Acidimicrobiia bacterium]|nr:DUF4349 domain-containing protein [Acidimicrobiia bacterium]
MIDEAVLEDLLGRLADEIPVPPNGPDRVVDQFVSRSGGRPSRPDRSKWINPLLIAAAIVAVIAISVPVLNAASSSSSAKTASAPATDRAQLPRSVSTVPPDLSSRYARGRNLTNGGNTGIGSGSGEKSQSGNTVPGTGAAGPVDSAKIVKTGSLDLQVAHSTLRVTVNRVTGVAVGLGGYIAESKTNAGGSSATAQITLRVPVANFENAITRLSALPGGKVLADSENGADVTGQYTDLQAQLRAATTERDALLGVLAHAQSIGDILAVHDRVAAAGTTVEQLQGRINLLDSQATFSSLAVTLSEKPTAATPIAAHRAKPQTGLAKSWSDARRGFSNGIEWLISRSGGALIVLLAALALLFGVRYLYPVVRRALV